MNRSIFIIRHGEKPADGKNGMDADGKIPSPHSLSAVGWQRAKALPTLFDAPLAWFPTPTQLIAPDYGKEEHNKRARTYQTLLEFDGEIETPCAKGQEAELGRQVAAAVDGVTLICWEHHAIHEIANAIRTAPDRPIPQSWPDGRFDVVWVFEAIAPGAYAFSQVPQLLLPGDEDSIIDP